MSRSVPDATAAAGAFLLSSRNADSGWGYAPGDASIVEASSAAALAVGVAAVADTDATIEWLLAAQNDDGGWGIAMDDDESGWHTAWAMLALTGHADAAGKLDAATAWLLAHEGIQARTADDPDKRDPILDIDLSLRAWPWLHDQAPWVEPTSLALLALSHCRASSDTEMIAEAVHYLQDRRCQDGGWNFGNPHMFVPLLPRPEPTAWAVMALHASSPESIIASDLAVLRTQSQSDGGAMAAALTLLCLHRVGEQVEGETEAVLAGQEDDGGWAGSNFCTALATLALTGAVL